MSCRVDAWLRLLAALSRGHLSMQGRTSQGNESAWNAMFRQRCDACAIRKGYAIHGAVLLDRRINRACGGRGDQAVLKRSDF